ncbi:hypothetical protein [Sphingomonas sp. PAMC 26617]|uniref:hypothetical protein n=1 Tax=Sphingomonas sp. PAMC 26617 TaxID=1112216 RepID=UPI0006842744|nr:hypothetical protein [Sphingomonas sp. PAMC 26617]
MLNGVSRQLSTDRLCPRKSICAVYLRFDTSDPDRLPHLVEAGLVRDVKADIDSLSGVANYVNRTFSLFSHAQHRRPKRMLVKA